jgi:hypothetical protein
MLVRPSIIVDRSAEDESRNKQHAVGVDDRGPRRAITGYCKRFFFGMLV